MGEKSTKVKLEMLKQVDIQMPLTTLPLSHTTQQSNNHL